MDAISKAAAAECDSASLLTQAPEDSYVFTTRIGNIQSGEKVFVEITYIGELKLDHGAESIRFTVPTVIAPRYAYTQSIRPPPVTGPADGRIRFSIMIQGTGSGSP